MQQLPDTGPALLDVFKEDPWFFVLALVLSQLGTIVAFVAFFRRRTAAMFLSLMALILAFVCIGGAVAARSNRISRAELGSANLSSADKDKVQVAAQADGNYMLKSGLILASLPFAVGTLALLVGRRKKK